MKVKLEIITLQETIRVLWAKWKDNKESVQLLSRVRLFATAWIAARQASLSIANSWSSLRLTSIESAMQSSQRQEKGHISYFNWSA